MNNINRGFKQRTMCEKTKLWPRTPRRAVRPRTTEKSSCTRSEVRPRDRDRARESGACDAKYFPAFSCSVFVSIPPSVVVDAPREMDAWVTSRPTPARGHHLERTSMTPTTRATVGRRALAGKKDARVSSHRWGVACRRWEGFPRRGWMVTWRWME